MAFSIGIRVNYARYHGEANVKYKLLRRKQSKLRSAKLLRVVDHQSNRAISVVNQTQRRTATPFTITVLHTAGGLRTTTAPAAPAQPARTTPRAQTTALASDTARNGVEARMKTPIRVERAKRIMSSVLKSGF
jgi:hypothetical protein